MATLVQQRGETAVLGIGVHRPSAMSAPYDVSAASSLALPLRETISAQEARLAARGVARRKLKRRENGEI
jgi:hypothetical protein